MVALVDHGVPVVSSRQFTTGLSPNAAGDGWNFIAASYTLHSTHPIEWVVLKGLTGDPASITTSISDTASGYYPISVYTYANQLRAPNGRIFWPLEQNYLAYYDPTTEAVSAIGPIIESPATNPNASTAPYASAFDSAGMLYFATQESANRSSCVFSVDPTTLDLTILGYVGSSAVSYTTYGYYIVADTGGTTKYVYVAYGEDPWQLWALELTGGTAAKLYEVPSTGHIAFSEISGQGWVATIDTDLGQPDNVRTQWWCQDGAISAYAVGVASPSPRDVAPASNPLSSPPELDISGGIGIVGWRSGSSGPYAYVNYSVNYTSPCAIESLIATSDGVFGNAAQYQGFFRYVEPADTHTWFGVATGLVSGGPRALVDDKIYFSGYPNGPLYAYDPIQSWQTGTNPALIGYYAPNGTELSGVKYADYFAWSPGAGSGGRLYMAGRRDRDGVGSGLGSWDRSANTFAGTYASPLGTVQPQGLVALDALGCVAMSTNTLSGSGSAPLLVFDQDLILLNTYTPLASVSNVGQIVPTANSRIICGIVQGSNNSLGLWQFNVAAGVLVRYTELPITGALGIGALRSDGSYWIVVGTNMVRIDPSAMSAAVVEDLSSITPIGAMAFGADDATMYLAGASDGTESQVWSRFYPPGTSDHMTFFGGLMSANVGIAHRGKNGTLLSADTGSGHLSK